MPEHKNMGTMSGALFGLMASALLWLIFVGSIILSYVGLLFFMALANLMSVNNSGWLKLLMDSPRAWIDIFGFAVPIVLQGLVGLTIILGLAGALIGFVVSLLRPT